MAVYKAFVGQPLTLRLDTDVTLSGGSGAAIYYRKPDGSTGSVSGSVENTTEIVAAVTPAILNMAGAWKFYGSYTFSGDSAATPTESVTVQVYNVFDA